MDKTMYSITQEITSLWQMEDAEWKWNHEGNTTKEVFKLEIRGYT